MRTDVSRSPTNSPQFAGISAGPNAGRAVSVVGRGRDSVDFGCWSLGSANPFLAPAGVAHEDRPDQIDKPSIAYWRHPSARGSGSQLLPRPRRNRTFWGPHTERARRAGGEWASFACPQWLLFLA